MVYVFITSGLFRISKAFLVLSLVKNSAFGVGFGFGDNLFFRLSATVKRLFAVVVTVLIYLVQKLLGIDFLMLAFALICVPSMNTVSGDK